MDFLIRQLRGKSPNGVKEDRVGSSAARARGQQLTLLRTRSLKGGGQDKEGKGGTTRDQRLPTQKTQSLKGEKKRTQSWLRRQFSRHMSQDYDSSIGGEYQIAVAAAAFAVKSLEETRTRGEKKGRHGPDTSITKIKNKEDDIARVPEPRAKSIAFSYEVSKPNLDAQDRNVQITSETSEKKPEKTGGIVPALKKKLSFAYASSPDKSLDRTPSRKPESTKPKPDFPPLKQPQFQPVDSIRQSPTKPAVEDHTADGWEKAELARINKKYEKLNTAILDWENEKKKKAKRKIERIEAELDERRAKALQHCRSELARIDSIAGGARSQATENRRNEELKVKEKANKIRLTGKVPATCLCF